MVLSEAGAAGLPCISTTVAGIPEVIMDGQSGLLIPPADGKALYTALERLADDPALRIRQGKMAQEIVTQHFDAVKNSERLANLLVETISSAREQGAPHG